ncbi:MAG: OmpA family protein, partial [Candidatus Methylumidiphilus sp.]
MNKLPIVLACGLYAAHLMAAEDCAKLEQTFQQSLAENHLDAGLVQLNKIESACPGNTLKNAQRLYTDSIARQANDLLNQGRTQEAEALLGQAKTLSWAVSSVRGEIAAKAKNWKEAAQQYALAFELATDPSHVNAKDVPNFQQIQQKLYRLASDSQLQYGKMDASIKRGGAPSGILLGRSRGFNIEPAAVPIHFDTGKASISPDSEDAIVELAAYIRHESPVKKVILLGFADPRGNPDTNLALSQKRADMVAAKLKKNHIQAEIETHGEGASKPPDT